MFEAAEAVDDVRHGMGTRVGICWALMGCDAEVVSWLDDT